MVKITPLVSLPTDEKRWIESSPTLAHLLGKKQCWDNSILGMKQHPSRRADPMGMPRRL
jgi:hypothetical protein